MSSAVLDPGRPRLAEIQGPEGPPAADRPVVRGPFLYLSEQKLVVKAVTYGTFAADEKGDLFPRRAVVRRDFALMRRARINAIRTYTPPPTWLLEEARAAGLRVLVGIHWEARNCSYDDPEALKAAQAAVGEAVERSRTFSDTVLAYVLGNEVPPLVARFHGRRPIERFLRRLYDLAKKVDPAGLVTYGNYPSTEFLQLAFLDFYTFNVFLRQPQSFSAYLDRMLIESKGKPFLFGEVGDDSLRRGEKAQAELLDWTIRAAFQKGACGVCAFSWTDDWVVGGQRIEDWAFGLLDRERRPKPAYEVVERRFGESPFAWREGPWPRVSVVVCNYNGAATLDETLLSLEALQYPNYEIIYVDDGSSDHSLAIARRHAGRVKIISQENQGLSVARNVGAQAATGEIVAYIDSDAYADPDWLRFLVLAMDSGEYAGAGGPNLTPPADGFTAQLIALCPGNPTHVLRDNVRADHIAGVNMAFRREVLLAIGGFDPVHRRAGDDVDICWRLEDAGFRLAFSPAAIVWHHRRPSIRAFLKQQRGYGEAENQLERKHPERFNLGGYIRWSGRVYTAPRSTSALFRPFVHHGPLGTALFQTLYQKEPSHLAHAPTMIQWYMTWAMLLIFSPLSPWLLLVGLGLLSLSLWAALVAGLTTELPYNLTPAQTLKKVSVITLLHFLHPLMRWYGRIEARLKSAQRAPWGVSLGQLSPDPVCSELQWVPLQRKEVRSYWGVRAPEREELIRALHRELKGQRTSVSFGREWDNCDLILNGTAAAKGRLYTAPEHYDQALSCGFKGYFSAPLRGLIALTSLGALVASHLDGRFVLLFAFPIIVLWYGLGARASLRAKAWEAVEAVMERRGAQRFEA